MRAVRLLPVVAAAVIAAAVVRADAASIGEVDAQTLAGWVVSQPGDAPKVVCWDDFTGTTGSNIHDRPTNGCGLWQATTKDWTLDANQASTGGAGTALVAVDAGTQNASVSVLLAAGATVSPGLVALRSPTDEIVAYYSRSSGGTVSLYKRDGTSTLLGAVKNVGTPPSATMTIDATSDTIRVEFDGVEVLTYTLTPAEIAVLKTAANSGYGLVAESDADTRFDDFHVDV